MNACSLRLLWSGLVALVLSLAPARAADTLEARLALPDAPVQVGGTVRVTVTNAPAAAKTLQLFLDGELIAQRDGKNPGSGPFTAKGEHTFILTMDTDALRNSWARLLKEPTPGKVTHYDLQLGVAETGERISLGQGGKKVAVPVWSWPSAIALALVVLVLVVSLGFLWPTSLLRDPGEGGVDASGNPLPASYSLGLSQMAFWTVIVIPTYVFIWTTTGRLDSLNESVLVLIGVSAATGLGSVFIGQSKRTATIEKIKLAKLELAKAQSELDSYVAQLAAAPAGGPKHELRAKRDLTSLETQRLLTHIKSLEAAIHPTSENSFWKDILSDSDGLSFHRFQLVAWTIVLGLVFLVNAYENLAMQSFNGTLLALMGISSGTYLGFKFPEK